MEKYRNKIPNPEDDFIEAVSHMLLASDLLDKFNILQEENRERRFQINRNIFHLRCISPHEDEWFNATING